MQRLLLGAVLVACTARNGVASYGKDKDHALEVSKDQWLEIKTTEPALSDVTVELYLRLSSCDVQGIVSQRLQMKKRHLSRTLRQQLPKIAGQLDTAIGKMASEHSLVPGIQALRGAALYSRAKNASSIATELENSNDYELDQAVEEANTHDHALFWGNLSNATGDVSVPLEPPIPGRGIMVSPKGELVFWSRDDIGVWRGVSAVKCSALLNGWHHIALVQQQERLLAYVDGEYKGRVTMAGHQGGQYETFWTFGRFSDGPPFPASGAIDDVRIWGRAIANEELICGLRGSGRSSSGLQAFARLDEGKGFVCKVAGDAGAEVKRSSETYTKTTWTETGAKAATGPEAPPAPPALSDEKRCEKIASDTSSEDPEAPPSINELHHIASADGGCPDQCSSNGRCNYKTGTCFCFTGFVGEACEDPNYAGYALQFSAQDESRLQLLPLGQFKSMSISMWLMPTALTGWRSLVHYIPVNADAQPAPEGTMTLELEDGKVRFLVNGNLPLQLDFEVTLKKDEWQLLTLTYSMKHAGRVGTGAASVYLDGLFKETLPFQHSGPVFLGGGWFGGQKPFGRYYDGFLDELRIFSRVLSPLEVIGSTSGRLRGTNQGLQAYYRFDEGSGRIAVDLAQDPALTEKADEKKSKADKDKPAPLLGKELPTRFDALLSGTVAPAWVPSTCPLSPCPGKPPCSNQGRCYRGKCDCVNGFTGKDCSIEACPGACAGHGRCVEFGEGDSTDALESLGMDVGSLIAQLEAKVGSDISSIIDKPINAAIANEIQASRANQVVTDASTSAVTNITKRILSNHLAEFFSKSDIKKGQCICVPPYAPPTCETMRCPKDCSGHGLCHNAACMCDSGFGGIDCTDVICSPEPDCSGNGNCIAGECICNAGWSDDGCTKRVACPNDCSGNGQCERGGVCKCEPKFTGKDCAYSVGCTNFCSGRGDCVADKCVCDALFVGPDCSEVACPKDCSEHGDCVGGLCLCEAGYVGDDCSQSALWPLRCTTVRRGMSSSSTCSRGWVNIPAPGSKVLDLSFEADKPTIMEFS